MYNIIFYEKEKEIEENGVLKKYRVPTKFVFNTATNADRFLANNKLIESFNSHMPSLNSAVEMFAGSSVSHISSIDEEGNIVSTEFASLTNAEGMFKRCHSLTDINIDMPSLINATDMFYECKNLTSVSGSFASLENGYELFYTSPSLIKFEGNLDKLKDGTSAFAETNLTSFSTPLPSLEIGKYMFENTPLESFTVSLPSLKWAEGMFRGCHSLGPVTEELSTDQIALLDFSLPNLLVGDSMFEDTSFENIRINAPKVTSVKSIFNNNINLKYVDLSFDSICDCQSLFKGNTSLEHVILNVPNAINLSSAFNNCSSLTSVNLNLPAVERAAGMFIGCTKLESVTLSVPHIQHANNMFENLENLTSINCDLSSLKEATKMFKGTGIKSFSGNLDSLLIAEAMFSGTGLTTFNSSLSSLEAGINMFKNCKLDSKSVLKIVETLPKVNKECQITIGIGVDESTTEKLNQFAIDTGVYNSWSDLKLALSNKGWYCTWRNALDAEIKI